MVTGSVFDRPVIGYKGPVQLAPRQLDLFRNPRAGGTSSAEEGASTSTSTAAAPTAPPPIEASGAKAPRDGRATAAPRHEVLAQARALAQKIADRLGGQVKVQLSVHDNRSTMISFRRQAPVLKVRVHHMFLDAPSPVIDALADYTGRGRRAAGQVLDDFISLQQERIRAMPRTPAALESRGQCFDLQEVFDGLNRELFAGALRARIGWGRQTSRRRRKSIRLGVYDHKAREIRLHPALDRPDVPRFFVEYIVFHEMLHQLFPSDRPDGRNVHHPRAFRERERSFPRYEAAITWEKEHLNQLLRS